MDFFASTSKYFKATLGSLVLLSLVVGFLCISFLHTFSKLHVGMESEYMIHTSGDTTMHACCNTGITDHAEFWKSISTGIPQDQLYLLMLLAAVFVAVSVTDLFGKKRVVVDALTARFRWYVREHPHSSLFDPIRLAFRKGILHPKTF